ncbi:unnamed protein product [Larinioides sclopetarius]|uniref:Craniofacial development protein 1 n=1 Tax=Larinioides sclopetarius TaxID=280406 RepID=A0AAV1Z161_9ARAC
MSSILDMSASSDSEDDVDYVPPSNVAASDSSCDEELVSDEETFDSGDLNGMKKAETTKKKGQHADVKNTESDSVDEKKRANQLWENFLNDVESVAPPIKTDPAVCKGNNASVISNRESDTKPSKVDAKPVSKVFEFAGEREKRSDVTVDKDVNSGDSVAEKDNSQLNNIQSERPPCKKRGIDSVLGTILNKNKKLNVLEKSKMDWATFKKDEGLENELEKINKGKQGFIERQRFLERSDLRSFEMEKSMRQTIRKK